MARSAGSGDDGVVTTRSTTTGGRRWLRAAVAVVALLGAGAPALAPVGTADAASWTGGVDLYRAGTFSTQRTWLWCTAADVQIIRNIVERETDHSRAAQARYFDYMRARNRYAIPESDGVDPAGWTAGLRRFVDDRYRMVASRSFDAALRSAVTSLRRTGLPVGITVGRGTHAWVLTGFNATADPATTDAFRVTTVRVVGPLWGLQSRRFGYDMRPNTELTTAELQGFFTPWHYGRVRMAWEGRWVSIQPIGKAPAAPAPSASQTAPLASSPSLAAGPVRSVSGLPLPATPSAGASATARPSAGLNPAPPDPNTSAPILLVAGLVGMGLVSAFVVIGVARRG